MRFVAPLSLLLAACAGAPAPAGPAELRWRLRAGDRFEVRFRLSEEGRDRLASSELDLELRIDGVGADGAASGTMTLKRFLYRKGGPVETYVLFENGEVKEARGDDGVAALLKGQGKPIPYGLLPTGVQRPVPGGAPLPILGALPALGLPLPGRTLGPGESWTSPIRAAYDDFVESRFEAEAAAGAVAIRGRSTPEAEAKHRIRIAAVGTFLPAEGYLRDAAIDLDFTPLDIHRKTRITTELRPIRP